MPQVAWIPSWGKYYPEETWLASAFGKKGIVAKEASSNVPIGGAGERHQCV